MNEIYKKCTVFKSLSVLIMFYFVINRLIDMDKILSANKKVSHSSFKLSFSNLTYSSMYLILFVYVYNLMKKPLIVESNK